MGKRERGKHADPDYLPVKVPKRYPNTRKVQNDISCVICNGDEGPLSVEEEKRNIGTKGLNSLVEASRRHDDDVARRISQLEPTALKFHNECRIRYVHRRQTFKLQRPEPKQLDGVSRPFLRSETSPLITTKHCFVCGEEARGRNETQDELISSCKKPEKIWDDVLSAAYQRKDRSVIDRLSINACQRGKVLCYHKLSCYQLYINPRNIQAARNKSDGPSGEDTLSIHHKVGATLATQLYHRLFFKKEVLLLTEARQKYVQLLIEAGLDTEVANNVRSSLVKSKLIEAFGNQVVFFHRTGQAAIFCSVDVTVGYLKDHNFATDADEAENDHDGCPSTEPDDLILLKAASILRKEIEQVPETKEYPCSNEITLDHSEELLPKKLVKMIQLLVDGKAVTSPEASFVSDETTRRWYIAISESILYCSRQNYASRVLPPLQVGLMLQLYHQFGSKTLIQALHAHGLSASYDELRLFLTSAAKQETERAETGAYIPPGLISREEETSCIIHEGNDNIDINVETVDGKNTYHSMARVVFQDQPASRPTTHQRVKRPSNPSSKDRTLEEDFEECLTKPVAFIKPKVKPEFQRCVDALSLMDPYVKDHNICVRDLTWCMLRNVSRESNPPQIVPFWTGFNSMLSRSHNMVTISSYAPTIEAPPTNMGTVYTVLKRGQEVTQHLGQPYQVHTFDQQLYAIAQQVKWSHPLEFPHLTIRLGGFHTLCTFTACIGKLWGDSGLKDLLVDSGVYAAGTVERMMTGHQFHRAVRGLTLCFEVLMGRFIDAFLRWENQQHPERGADTTSNRLHRVLTETETQMKEGRDLTSAIENLDHTISETILKDMDTFRECGSKKSPTFKHWLECLDLLQVVLIYIRAEREGDWLLHIESLVAMLPYFFACNRQNYARWASIYLIDMLSHLPDEVREAFKAGQFTVKRSAGKYNGIWSDMGVESTVIRDSKSRSGIIGLTGRGTSLLRWSLTRQLLGRYAAAMQERSKHGASSAKNGTHEQQRPAMLLQDEQHSETMSKHMVDNFMDPFRADDHPKGLISISSGLNATAEVEKSLLSCRKAGTKALKSFVNDRLSTEGHKSIWDVIPRSGLVTFTDMKKPTKVNVASRKVAVAVSAEVVFRRALILTDSRKDVSIHKILSRPMTSVPTMLFKEDGSRQTTTKAELIHWLEDRGSTLRALPRDSKTSIYIVDGMADVQAKRGSKFRTFNDLGESFLHDSIQLLGVAEEVHVIYDRYDIKDSVKAEERARRLGKETTKTYTIVPGATVPPWRKFLNSLGNKEALARFLSDFLIYNSMEYFSRSVFANKALYVSGGFQEVTTTKRVSTTGIDDCKDLEAHHEEADTRIIFHLMDADRRMFAIGNTNVRATVKTQDTDVVCLAVHFFPKMSAIAELWIHAGSVEENVNNVRFIAIHEVCRTIGPMVCKILPAVHALTGCDAVSSLYFIGKKTIMKVVAKSNGEEFKDLVTVGEDREEDAVTAARKLFIALYDPQRKFQKPPLQNLNDLRVRLARRNNQSLARLPPCEDSFLQHVKRASWQAKVWMHADLRSPMVSPVGHGWQKETGTLLPVFFHGETAAEMLDDLVCSCSKRGKCEAGCSCSLNGMECIDLCSCEAGEFCNNPRNRPNPDESSE